MEEISFITENGVVLDIQERVIITVPGFPSHVNFPEETILKLHKLQPGYIDRFVHTHPIGMFNLSSADEAMLRRWAVTIHPFPIRLSTLTTDNRWDVVESIYVARLEPKECWIERQEKEQQSSYRNIIIELESEKTYWPGDNTCPTFIKNLYKSSFRRG